ncbi:MAG: hypothetical protein LBB76_06665 [Azoarcus sp.]|jgi:hypothetical protein|nr:hypothetical protein [Azoarcus sp.]
MESIPKGRRQPENHFFFFRHTVKEAICFVPTHLSFLSMYAVGENVTTHFAWQPGHEMAGLSVFLRCSSIGALKRGDSEK